MRTTTKKPPKSGQSRQKRNPPNPNGGPVRDIDLKALEKLCEIGCIDLEICAILRISHDTLSRRKQDPAFMQLMEGARARRTASLRRMQWMSAEAGSIPMQIFLGKNMLGQRDKFDEQADTSTDKAREFAQALKTMMSVEADE